MPPELTPTRIEILSLLLRLAERATLTQLASSRGISKQGMQKHLDALSALGYLHAPQKRYGPYQLTDRARGELGLGIPIYGQIAAGTPTLAEQIPDEVTPSLDALIGLQQGDYLLKVQGESMTGIGVMDGDYVLVRPTDTVQDGEVAVVLIPGENAATLKRLYHFAGDVVLRSENPNMGQMSYPAEQVRVQGRMVGRLGGVPSSRPRRR